MDCLQYWIAWEKSFLDILILPILLADKADGSNSYNLEETSKKSWLSVQSFASITLRILFKRLVSSGYLENFTENATKRVRLGVILNKIIEDNDLKSDAEVVKSLIDERSSGFKDPEQYRNWIYGNEEQLKNIESLALEEQVTELLISQSKSEDENLSFEEVMTMS